MRAVPTAVMTPSRPSRRAGSRPIVAIPASNVCPQPVWSPQTPRSRADRIRSPGRSAGAGVRERLAAATPRVDRPCPDDLPAAHDVEGVAQVDDGAAVVRDDGHDLAESWGRRSGRDPDVAVVVAD